MPTSAAAVGIGEESSVLAAIRDVEEQGSIRVRMMGSDKSLVVVEAIGKICELVRSYTGAAGTVDDPAYSEMFSMFVAHFGHMSIRDIPLAFRQAASGTLDGIDRKDFSTWYGNFPVSAFGQIIRAYDNHRKLVVLRHQQSQRANARALEAQDMAAFYASEAGQQVLREQFEAGLSRLMAQETVVLNDVTVYDYKMMRKYGYITDENLSIEAMHEIMAKATVRLIDDHRTQILGCSRTERQRLLNEIETAQLGNPTELFIIRTKAIAQRMAVLRWIEMEKAKQS